MQRSQAGDQVDVARGRGGSARGQQGRVRGAGARGGGRARRRGSAGAQSSAQTEEVEDEGAGGWR
eukprot:5211580-Pleurochrysis_carterae.AAC.1